MNLGRFSSITVAIALSCNIHAQSLLNQKAPALDLGTVLQGDKTTATKLEGRFTLLEFWATWCTPCVKNIPHLNELTKKFRGKNIDFISITDEPKDKISQFVKAKKIEGIVAIDNAGRTFSNYHVKGRPETFIIDNQGVVVFQGNPENLTGDVITKILAGNYSEPQEAPQEKSRLGGFSGGQDPVINGNFDMDTMQYLYHDVLRKSVDPYYGSATMHRGGEVGISLMHMNINEIVAFLSNQPSAYRVLNRSSVDTSKRWDIIFSRKTGFDMQKGIDAINDMVASSFNISVKNEQLDEKVLLPSYNTEKLTPAAKLEGKDVIYKQYERLSAILERLEAKTGHIIYIDKDADNWYVDVFALGTKYYTMPGDELKEWLKNQGITFAPDHRKMRVQIIENK